MGSQGALKNMANKGLGAPRLKWVKLQIADGTGKGKYHIFKVEPPQEHCVLEPFCPSAEIRAWNICLEKL